MNLQRVLRANSVFSVLSAMLLWWDAGWLAATIGVVSAADLRAVAAPVFLFGLWVGWLSTRKPPPAAALKTVFGLDVAWVAGSAALLALVPGFSGPGSALIAAVAAIVSAFAFLEWKGLRLQKHF